MLKDMLIIKANDDNIKDLVESRKTANLNYIDTTNVTVMSDLFLKTKFYGDISLWNTSNVVNMHRMFLQSTFNVDIVTGKQIGRAHV